MIDLSNNCYGDDDSCQYYKLQFIFDVREPSGLPALALLASCFQSRIGFSLWLRTLLMQGVQSWRLGFSPMSSKRKLTKSRPRKLKLVTDFVYRLANLLTSRGAAG